MIAWFLFNTPNMIYSKNYILFNCTSVLKSWMGTGCMLLIFLSHKKRSHITHTSVWYYFHPVFHYMIEIISYYVGHIVHFYTRFIFLSYVVFNLCFLVRTASNHTGPTILTVGSFLFTEQIPHSFKSSIQSQWIRHWLILCTSSTDISSRLIDFIQGCWKAWCPQKKLCGAKNDIKKK